MMWPFRRQRDPLREYVGPEPSKLSVYFVVQRHEEEDIHSLRVVLRGTRSGEIHFQCPRSAIHRFPVGERVRFTLDDH